MEGDVQRSDWEQTEDVERDGMKCINSLSALVLPSSTLTSYCNPISDGLVRSEKGSVTAGEKLLLIHHISTTEHLCHDERERLMSGIPDRPGQKRNLSIYAQRLDTFQDGPQPWTRANPSAEYLARVGFWHTGYEQIVCCFVCEVKLSEWDDGKDPLIKHHYKNPDCSFIHRHFSSELKELLSQARLEHLSPQYSRSSYRLHSFSTWLYGNIVTSYQLASAGFFYTGYGSRVECFSCGLVYGDWKKGDIPLHVHKLLRPNCSFISSFLSKEQPSSSHVHHLPPTPSDYPASRVPDYTNVSVRVRSFKHLAKSFPVSSEACAKAGLFFLRKPDVMKCFSCGAVVRDWMDGDVPAEKHREVNSGCSFLREFFPTKLIDNAQDDEHCVGVCGLGGGVDPSTLPEPEFDEDDLERMSLQQKLKPEPNYEQLEQKFSSVSLEPHPQPSQSLAVRCFS